MHSRAAALKRTHGGGRDAEYNSPQKCPNFCLQEDLKHWAPNKMTKTSREIYCVTHGQELCQLRGTLKHLVEMSL